MSRKVQQFIDFERNPDDYTFHALENVVNEAAALLGSNGPDGLDNLLEADVEQAIRHLTNLIKAANVALESLEDVTKNSG